MTNCSLSFQGGNRSSGGGGSVPMSSEARMRAVGQVVQPVLCFL